MCNFSGVLFGTTESLLNVSPLFLSFRVDGFFTNSSHYKNANFSNFVLAVPFEINYTNEVRNFKMQSSYIP